MLRLHLTFLIALAAFSARAFQSAPKTFDPASIAVHLDNARSDYEKAVEAITAALLVSLDEREHAARQATDGEGRDRALAEREALRLRGRWPGCIENPPLAKRLRAARKAFEETFAALIGDCMKNRLDQHEAALRERLAVFRRTSDLAPWSELEVNAGEGSRATAWTKRDDPFISPEFGGSPEPRNMLRFDGLPASDYLLELRIQRTAGSGGLMLGLRDPDGRMVEFRVAAASDGAALLAPGRRAPLRVLVSVQQGRMAVEADGASNLVWKAGESALECPKHLEGLPAGLYLRSEDSSARFRVDPPRAKPLGDYTEPPLPEEPPAPAPVVKEALLPQGSSWTGARRSGNDSLSCEMYVDSRDDKSVVFVLSEGTFQTKWFGEVNGTRLKITGMVVLKKGGFNQREWSRPRGNGQVSDDQITLKWSWHWEGPQKSVNEEGTITLRRNR